MGVAKKKGGVGNVEIFGVAKKKGGVGKKFQIWTEWSDQKKEWSGQKIQNLDKVEWPKKRVEWPKSSKSGKSGVAKKKVEWAIIENFEFALEKSTHVN